MLQFIDDAIMGIIKARLLLLWLGCCGLCMAKEGWPGQRRYNNIKAKQDAALKQYDYQRDVLSHNYTCVPKEIFCGEQTVKCKHRAEEVVGWELDTRERELQVAAGGSVALRLNLMKKSVFCTFPCEPLYAEPQPENPIMLSCVANQEQPWERPWERRSKGRDYPLRVLFPSQPTCMNATFFICRSCMACAAFARCFRLARCPSRP